MFDVAKLVTKNIVPPFEVELYDQAGRKIRFEISEEVLVTIQRDLLSPGFYILQIKKDDNDENLLLTRKL